MGGAIFNKLQHNSLSNTVLIESIVCLLTINVIYCLWVEKYYHCMVRLGVPITMLKETELEKNLLDKWVTEVHRRLVLLIQAELISSKMFLKRPFWCSSLDRKWLVDHASIGRTGEDDRNGIGWADKALGMRLLSVYQK